MKRILMVATEAKPYATAGGTSDVVGVLPKVLRQKGYDVRLVLPHYSALFARGPYEVQHEMDIPVPVGTRPLTASVHQARLAAPDADGERYPVQLIGGDPFQYFAQADGEHLPIYPSLQNTHVDAGRLYAFFCRAVLELVRQCAWQGWQADIIHCHDWPTGLLPVIQKSILRLDPCLRDVRTVFTIHNISDVVYQGGWFTPSLLPYAGLPLSLFSRGWVEHNDRVNMIKAGIVFADRVNTVSAGYAEEIKRGDREVYARVGEGWQEFQCSGGLHYVWSHHHKEPIGIRNGIDDAYDPRTIGQDGDWPPIDQDWQERFSAGRPIAAWAYSAADPDLWRKKNDLKCYLQERCNRLLGTSLAVDAGVPVIAVRSRLAEQKGFDLLIEGLRRWDLPHPVQFIITAWGDDVQARQYGTELDYLAQQHPTRIAFTRSRREIPEALHYAAADMLLMPSLFEPCGLPHMMALRYGTIPIVRRTGGLADVVEEFDPVGGTGNGFDFVAPDHREMSAAVARALRFYQGPAHWQQLLKNAVRARDRGGADFSWSASADRYIAELYL